jgi:hypothetical protein
VAVKIFTEYSSVRSWDVFNMSILSCLLGPNGPWPMSCQIR